MLEDEKQRFAEALAHWAEAIDSIRARERAEAIAQVEELEKMRIRRCFYALGLHHALKPRRQDWVAPEAKPHAAATVAVRASSVDAKPVPSLAEA